MEFVHPHLPILDPLEFLKAVNDKSGSSGKISLLLFHAVLFAGIAFVDNEHLKNVEGYDRRAMRLSYYRKTRASLDPDSPRLYTKYSRFFMTLIPSSTAWLLFNRCF